MFGFVCFDDRLLFGCCLVFICCGGVISVVFWVKGCCLVVCVIPLCCCDCYCSLDAAELFGYGG